MHVWSWCGGLSEVLSILVHCLTLDHFGMTTNSCCIEGQLYYKQEMNIRSYYVTCYNYQKCMCVDLGK